jgi:hypothetical protein
MDGWDEFFLDRGRIPSNRISSAQVELSVGGVVFGNFHMSSSWMTEWVMLSFILIFQRRHGLASSPTQTTPRLPDWWLVQCPMSNVQPVVS